MSITRSGTVFFRRAGFNVVTSRRTTRQLLEQGMSHVTVETCLPVKVYYGHVSDLIEKGIDSIFVRVTSTSRYGSQEARRSSIALIFRVSLSLSPQPLGQR